MQKKWLEFKAFLEHRFQADIANQTLTTALPAATTPLPAALTAGLRAALASQNIHELYTHQQEAFTSISAGQPTVIVAKTASGKTLSFLLPILNEYLQAPAPFTTLLLYPTKALARDQEKTLGRYLHQLVPDKRLGTFDGDTSSEERQLIRQKADFVISNPDMLHNGILPNHTRAWKSFLGRLRYIVIDEVHTYRGAYGSHVANVLKRLLRVCALHGSQPVFVCSSATIANPKEHAEALCHKEFTLIAQDGAPKPARSLYLMNPPLVQGEGGTFYRKGPGALTVPILRQAAKLGIRTICFVRARQEVERLHRAVIDGHPELASRVKPYRGGLLPSERRGLEADLVSGRITTVITTNALELGIDIGDLELCVLSGHPGSIASFWQRAGRVGRGGQESMVIFVAKNTSLDQYLVHHPDYLAGAPIEHAWLSANNPYILLQHLPCAAHEYPLRPEEPLYEPELYSDALAVLKGNATVVPYQGSYRYQLEDYPSRGVNLRGMTDYNIQIIHEGEVIGELDPIGARGTLYKDAIYQHLGRRYMSADLNLERKFCQVITVSADYYTEAVWEGRVELTSLLDEAVVFEHHLHFGEVNVNKQPKLYKKIRERSFENIGYGPITLPPFIYDTTGFSLTPSPSFTAALGRQDKRLVAAALYGLSYMIRQIAPSFCMGDSRDIDTDVYLSVKAEEGEGTSSQNALYVFDALEGGVGYAEKIFNKLSAVLGLCEQVIAGCPCPSGCPACVPPLPPGIDDSELERYLIESNAVVAATAALISSLQTGFFETPEIVQRHLASPSFEARHTPDPAQLQRRAQLKRASEMLARKRAREH